MDIARGYDVSHPKICAAVVRRPRSDDMPAMLAGGTLRALPTLLPFWLVLSFARDALVHLNAIVCSVAAVSERPDPATNTAAGRLVWGKSAYQHL